MSPKFIVTISSIAVLVAAAFVWRTLRPISDNYQPQPFVGVGQVLAEEATKALKNRGRVVVVITDAHEEPGSSLRLEWESFRSELKQHPEVEIAAIEIVPAMSDEGIAGCSSLAFKELLERHSQAEAIVFFVSLPDWRWLPSKVMLPANVTSKIIVCGDAPVSPKYHYTGYFTSGLVSALVSRRWATAPDPIDKPRTPREWFHNEYQVFTRENYDSLPE